MTKIDAIPDEVIPDDAWNVLQELLTDSRKERLLKAIEQRTRYVRLVVQDVHNPHNVSACMRSAEAFGIQNVDVVHLSQRFRPTSVARGVRNWITVGKHEAVQPCVDSIKAEGYRIYAGMPSPGSVPLDELPLDKPIAVLFGNEHEGVSDEWKEHCDGYFTIPMAGLVESMNISVCAAIAMHHLTHKCRSQGIENYFLSEEEKQKLLNRWVIAAMDKWEEKYKRLK